MAWTKFPHADDAYVYTAATLKKAWPRLHVGDAEPFPKKAELVEAWIALSAKLLVQPFVGISCVVNPEAIYVGGRLPTDLLDRLVAAVNARLAKLENLPALAPVARAATSADGPAVGAALLPFMDQLLPSRAALMKTNQG